MRARSAGWSWQSLPRGRAGVRPSGGRQGVILHVTSESCLVSGAHVPRLVCLCLSVMSGMSTRVLHGSLHTSPDHIASSSTPGRSCSGACCCQRRICVLRRHFSIALPLLGLSALQLAAFCLGALATIADVRHRGHSLSLLARRPQTCGLAERERMRRQPRGTLRRCRVGRRREVQGHAGLCHKRR